MGPIHFREIIKEKVWGGQNLARLLAKQLPTDKKVGESWELSDFGQDCSVVDRGQMRGLTLENLLAEHSPEITGRADVKEFGLLFKFLDAVETLSVQVHPNKHEAWYILEAREGAKLYLGLKEGVGRKEFQSAVAEDSVEQCLQIVEPKPGQCYYLPSGLTHALGAELVVAEIQTSEQITYRVYDWGRGRPIQVQMSLDTIKFHAGPQFTEPPEEQPGQTSLLLDCPHFSIQRAVWAPGQTVELSGRQMQVWMILRGAGRYRQQGQEFTLGKGQTVLMPASCENIIEIEEEMCVLITEDTEESTATDFTDEHR